MRIMSNIPALQSYNALSQTNSALQKSINRLSTGLRINSAADDAAGLAISEKMRAQIRGLNQAASNAQDGISMIQTAEGALGETHSILQRMRELSVQAANDTLTQQDRGYIQLEIDQLKEEVTRISNTTQFNKKKLLDGSAAVLWSSDNLSTKAIINGGLRQVDQFGQKMAVEGNFKISINASPGQAEIQKTDIFKIKHKNVIMNVSLDQNNGFQSIRVDSLPAGQYRVQQANNVHFGQEGFRKLAGAALFASAVSAAGGGIGTAIGSVDGGYSIEPFLRDSAGALVGVSALGNNNGSSIFKASGSRFFVALSAFSEGFLYKNRYYSAGTRMSGVVGFSAGINYAAGLFKSSAGNTDGSSIVELREHNEKALWKLLDDFGIKEFTAPKRGHQIIAGKGYELEPFFTAGVGFYDLEVTALVDALMSGGATTGFLFDIGSAAYSIGSHKFSAGTRFSAALEKLVSAASGSITIGDITINTAFTLGVDSVVLSTLASTSAIVSAATTAVSSIQYARDKNQLAIWNLFRTVFFDEASTYVIKADRELRTSFIVGNQANFNFNGFYGSNLTTASMNVSMRDLGNVENANVLLTVLSRDTAQGSVTFRAQVNQMDANGKVTTHEDANLIIDRNGVAVGYTGLGFTFLQKSAIRVANVMDFGVGNKLVLSFQSHDAKAKDKIIVSGMVNTKWPGAWTYSAGKGAKLGAEYNVNATALQNQTVHFKQFYLNTANGTVHEGDIVIGFNSKMKSLSAGTTPPPTRASFEAAYVGQVAKGDVKLRDLDKFWDANGRFMLEDQQELTLVQGDGKKFSFALNSTDTLKDIQQKMNDAIAYGLGQAQYVPSDADKFVSFVDPSDKEFNTPDAVEGTFVIRTLIPGKEGTLSFSGDEDLIKALSLNVIQPAEESSFTVSVADAHSGNTIASSVKTAGNILRGVINANVDVEFDSMANIKAQWNENTRQFDLIKDAGTYETILHLADNTTVFQIGANEGEDMGINIGDMSGRALGIDRVLVTDRESAARSITIIDAAIGRVSSQRAKLGAYQNRLEHTISNLTTASTNTTAAESRIRDVDMAKEMMNFTKLNILSQAGTNMLAQANQLPQNVLSLLK